jgi:hypothetical protein
MADSLIAEFTTQFAASAAVDKLLSRGVAREQLALRFDESVGRSAASASAPTTVISNLAHLGAREDSRHGSLGERIAHRLFRQRTPLDPPAPEALGYTHLVVRLDDPAAASALTELLHQAGAASVQREDVGLAVENPAVWPEPSAGAPADVQQARDAVPTIPRDPAPSKRPRH